MKKLIITLAFSLCAALTFQAGAQSKKAIYNEVINPLSQITDAVKKASAQDKYVICQVGGNWCRWCLLFADYISKDAEISKVIKDNYEYIHVNYPRTGASEALKKRLNYAGRFGFPVFVVMNGKGEIIHIQDSSFLESGEGYDHDKVMRFFTNWTPSAVSGR